MRRSEHTFWDFALETFLSLLDVVLGLCLEVKGMDFAVYPI